MASKALLVNLRRAEFILGNIKKNIYAFSNSFENWYHATSWNSSQRLIYAAPDSKVYGANMGPTWGRQDPGGLHVGPMNLAIWGTFNIIATDVMAMWAARTWDWINSLEYSGFGIRRLNVSLRDIFFYIFAYVDATWLWCLLPPMNVVFIS